MVTLGKMVRPAYQRLIRRSTITTSDAEAQSAIAYQRLIRRSTITPLAKLKIWVEAYQRLIRRSTITIPAFFYLLH